MYNERISCPTQTRFSLIGQHPGRRGRGHLFVTRFPPTTNSVPTHSPPQGPGELEMTISRAPVYDASLEYVAANLSVIPIAPNPTKRPAYGVLPVVGEWPDGRPRRGWAPLKSRWPTQTELRSWFNGWGCSPGVAVVCGRISGGLEAIDVDSNEHAEPWLSQVRQQCPVLVDRLVLVQTPRPGLHAYYRCPEMGGNKKLAQTIRVDESTGAKETKTIIETRGEGGYALIPPTPSYCHPSGRAYEYLTSRTLVNVETISIEDRDLLFQIARSFSSTPPPPQRPRQESIPRRPVDRRRPGDDFNVRADWAELLARHDWTLSHVASEGVQHWTRPDKAEGTSATVDYYGSDLLHVFTSNALPLEQDSAYTKFSFLTLMEFDGDFQAAAQALQQQGYGQQPLRPARTGRQGRRRHSSRRNRRRRR